MGAVGEHEEAMESETCGFPSPIVQPIERATQVTQEGSPTEEKAVQRDTQPAGVTTIFPRLLEGYRLMQIINVLIAVMYEYYFDILCVAGLVRSQSV